MFNHGQEPFKIARGDRIAQLICEVILYPQLEEAEVYILYNLNEFFILIVFFSHGMTVIRFN